MSGTNHVWPAPLKSEIPDGKSGRWPYYIHYPTWVATAHFDNDADCIRWCEAKGVQWAGAGRVLFASTWRDHVRNGAGGFSGHRDTRCVWFDRPKLDTHLNTVGGEE